MPVANKTPVPFSWVDVLEREGIPMPARGAYVLRAILAIGAVLVMTSAVKADLGEWKRGDLNGDGIVSWSDVYPILVWEFAGGPAPSCFDAADVNWDGKVNIADPIFLAFHLFSHPAYPISDDPTGWIGIGCDLPPAGSSLTDPAAKLRVSDAIVMGGLNRKARFAVTVSNGVPIAGLYGRVQATGAAFEDTDMAEVNFNEFLWWDLSGNDPQFRLASVHDGILSFGIIGDYFFLLELPPEEDVEALTAEVCLVPGTAAGKYPLALLGGELVAGRGAPGDWTDSGRAINPALEGGTLKVLSDILPDATCDSSGYIFSLGSAEGKRGETAMVSFSATSEPHVDGFSFSVRFDPQALEAVGVDRLLPLFGFIDTFDWSNEEGWVTGKVGIPAEGPGWLGGQEALRIRFRIRRDAPAGETSISFADGVGSSDGKNAFLKGDLVIRPGLDDSFVLVDGRINIIPDAAPFDRGDSNDDARVDLSDAVFTLAFLFLGGPPPACADAADANDDGTIDISDPVATLGALFLGQGSLPVVSEEGDPTPDDLGCR
jgi:hypothetical protein